MLRRCAPRCNAAQHVATLRSTLQRCATRCNRRGRAQLKQQVLAAHALLEYSEYLLEYSEYLREHSEYLREYSEYLRAQLKQQLLARHALFMLSAVIESPHAGVQANATRSPSRGSSAFLPRQ